MDLPDTRWQAAIEHSRYLRQLLSTRPALVERLANTWEQALTAESLLAAIDSPDNPLPSDDDGLKTRLRQVRQWAMAQLCLRDLVGNAPLSEIVEGMTLLADVTTNVALAHYHRQLAAQFGEPLDSQGQVQRLIIIGMGKLGGRELNVSSDVDYIFVYPEDGETVGGRKVIDNFDFFTRLGKKIINALGDITADGQVFRVDMRLRPNGDSGPLVCSLDALENYFITQGREWERYAWIKARVMNSGDNLQTEWVTSLQKIARPFIFRKYLDFGAINAMRDLHAQIRREVARKDMANHVKLGPGGIREIEFMAQVFQLIRGGRETWLQIRPTLSVLAQLAERRFITPESETELREAYVFLRRLEHRLQFVEDKQTHSLPSNAEDQANIARSMGFADWDSMLAVLNQHRAIVSRHFEAVFSDPEEGAHPLEALWGGQIDTESAIELLGEKGFRHPQAAWERLQQMRSSSRYVQLPASNRQRMDAVGPRLLEAASQTPHPDLTLERGLAFLDTVSKRGAYLALLQQYPTALRKVADMVGASSWAAEYLNRHPILLDEFLDPRLLEEGSDWASFEAELQQELALHHNDTEREMDILREAHHAQVFRLLAQDLAGVLPVESISDHLSYLADILVETTIKRCWQTIRKRHRDTPAFAVIGYGKLGGKELGYGSDLDLVFVYDDEHPDAQENYTRLGQRLTTWLGSTTPAGILFETDLRLRPNGDSGVLACSLAAFRQYQEENAWVWEHQALTRARAVAGDKTVGAAFEQIRTAILTQPRDTAALLAEVLGMRHKMRDSLGSSKEAIARGEFDIKHDAGGIVDVEFIMQYLILAHSHAHPCLTGNLGNIALLRMSADLGLIPAELAEPVRNAYRHYRRLQHGQRLNNEKARVSRDELSKEIAAVTALWQAVFASL